MNELFVWLLQSSTQISSHEWFLKQITLASLMGSFLFLIVGLIHRWVINFPRFWLTLLLALVLIRFSCFVTPDSRASALNLIPRTSAPSKVEKRTGTSASHAISTRLSNPSLQAFSEGRQFGETSSGEHKSTVRRSKFNLEPTLLIFLIWVSGFAISLFYFIRDWRLTQKLIARSNHAPAWLNAQLNNFLTGFANCPSVSTPDLRITNEVSSPAITGIVRRTLLIPEWCLSALTKEEMTCVLTHELCHIQRRDVELTYAMRLLGCIHWFNPLMAKLKSKVMTLRELGCDQQAIRWLQTNSMFSTKVIPAYGKALLKLESYFSISKQTSLQPAFFSNNALSIERILAMTNSKQVQGSKLAAILAVTLGFLFLASGFSKPLAAQQASKVSPPSSTSRTATKTEPGKNGHQAQRYTLQSKTLQSKRSDEVIATYPHPIPTTRLPLFSPMKTTYQQEVTSITIGNPKVLQAQFKNRQTVEYTATQSGESLVTVCKADGSKECTIFKAITIAADEQPQGKELFAVKVKLFEVDQERWNKSSLNTSAETPASIKRLFDSKAAKENHVLVRDLPNQAVSFLTATTESDSSSKPLTKISEPTMVSIVGTETEFVSGGEIPIHVKAAEGRSAIEFRRFGNVINATVIGKTREGTLMEIRFENSELVKNDENPDGVPGFRVRRASTAIKQKPNQWTALRAGKHVALFQVQPLDRR